MPQRRTLQNEMVPNLKKNQTGQSLQIKENRTKQSQENKADKILD